MTTNRRWWAGLIPESFTAVVGAIISLGLLIQSYFGGEPSGSLVTLALGCFGVGSVTVAVGVVRRYGEDKDR